MPRVPPGTSKQQHLIPPVLITHFNSRTKREHSTGPLTLIEIRGLLLWQNDMRGSIAQSRGVDQITPQRSVAPHLSFERPPPYFTSFSFMNIVLVALLDKLLNARFRSIGFPFSLAFNKPVKNA